MHHQQERISLTNSAGWRIQRLDCRFVSFPFWKSRSCLAIETVSLLEGFYVLSIATNSFYWQCPIVLNYTGVFYLLAIGILKHFPTSNNLMLGITKKTWPLFTVVPNYLFAIYLNAVDQWAGPKKCTQVTRETSRQRLRGCCDLWFRPKDCCSFWDD